MKRNKLNNKVAIIMGSKSDYSVMKECEKILKILKIKFQLSIVSAEVELAVVDRSGSIKKLSKDFFSKI